uniref:Complement factor B n=1 Tax=Leptobrachium leishanense TaxID=445787 RepID=A0A8C5MSS2_9ANUR
MLHFVLLSQVLVSAAFPTLDDTVPCDLSKVTISGGNYNFNEEDNAVEYSCPSGKYPYPGPTRKCLKGNVWEKQNIKAVCKDVRCPVPMGFENGEYDPKNTTYIVGDVLQFECWGGFELRGSKQRTCKENGKWSGKTTICEDYGGFCLNPGVPPGTSKDSSSYSIGDKVKYTCNSGLSMLGSNERECTEDKSWTGSEPSCRAWYTYDTAEEVADMFSSTLSATAEVADPDRNPFAFEKRKIKIKKGDPMNIFIILDASKSVGAEHFKTAKESTITLIEKISSFDTSPRYAVISYASKDIKIVRLSDDESFDPAEVIEKLTDFKYDGKHNMGGDPQVELTRIKNLLDIGQKDGVLHRDDYLDVYVFGLGRGIDVNDVNDLASKKNGEVHAYLLNKIDTMKNAFDSMIDETDAMDMCGLNKDIPEKYLNRQDFTPQKLKETIIEKFPWIAKIIITRRGIQEICKGSIVAKNFILTAAHCFHFEENVDLINVDVGDKKGLKVKDFYRHPLYKPEGKQDKHIRKSFDYDFALLELKEKLEFSATTRPICIPCTKSSSWALRKKGDDTKCKEHEDLLLKGELVKALFVAEETQKDMEQMDVTIKMGNARAGCLQAAKTLKDLENVTDIHDMVTDQFLCTGGTQPHVEPATCKGDSGGPLIIEYKKRYVQAGVISWGTVNHCVHGKRLTDPIPDTARDFHTSVFHVLPWIRDVVKNDLAFLPDI